MHERSKANAAADLSSAPLLANHVQAAGDSLATPPRESSMYNIVVVSIAFFVIFTSYNSLQNVVTSLLTDNLGNISLGILYASVCVFVFITPPVVQALGEKWTMVLGAAGYVVYMASLIHIVRPVVCVAAVIIGAGASILWVALGAFLTKCSAEEHIGRNTGIFWGIFQLSNVLGNLGVYFLFKSARSYLYITFTAVAGAGTLLLLLLRRPPTVPLPALAESLQLRSPARYFVLTVKMIFEPRMALVAPLFFFSGFEMAFWAGEFTQLFDSSSIGVVLMLAGVGEVVGGLAFGRLSDVAGRSVALVIGGAVFLVGLGLSAWLHESAPSAGPAPIIAGASIIAYAAALCMGLGDSAFNTQSYAVVQDLFPGESNSMAFSLFNLFQNAGSAAGFYLPLVLPMHGPHGTLALVWIQAAFLLVGSALFVAADKKFIVGAGKGRHTAQ